MSDPFDLPERPLPDGVREAARQRIANGLRSPRTGRKAPFAIAAAVIVLAAGAVVVTSNVQNLGNTLPPGAGNTSTSNSFGFPTPEQLYNSRLGWAPDLDVERCGRAAGSGHPARDLWQPLVTVNSNGAEVIAFRSPLGPFFCELTPAGVTLSTPSKAMPANGVPARMLFRSQYGTVAGVVSPEVRSLSVQAGSAPVPSEMALVTDGIFVVPNGFAATDGLAFLNDDTGIKYPIPAAELPSVSAPATDRPQQPVERTSPAGQRLARCLDHVAADPVVDPAYWQAGAYSVVSDRLQLQLARYGSLLATCEITDGVAKYMQARDLSRPSTVTGATIIANRWPQDLKTDGLTGIVTGDSAASITAGGAEATIANKTFNLLNLPRHQPGTRITVKDATGKVLEELALSNN